MRRTVLAGAGILASFCTGVIVGMMIEILLMEDERMREAGSKDAVTPGQPGFKESIRP